MSEQGIVVVVCAVVVAVGQIAVAWISHRTHKAVNSRIEKFLTMAEEKFTAIGELKGAAMEKREERERKAKLPKDADMGD